MTFEELRNAEIEKMNDENLLIMQSKEQVVEAIAYYDQTVQKLEEHIDEYGYNLYHIITNDTIVNKFCPLIFYVGRTRFSACACEEIEFKCLKDLLRYYIRLHENPPIT